MWQKIYDDYQDRDFVVIAVAMDNEVDAARPWIAEAKPTYPVLIDRYHRLADLYNMVNVPLGDRHYYPPADMVGMPTDGPPKA